MKFFKPTALLVIIADSATTASFVEATNDDAAPPSANLIRRIQQGIFGPPSQDIIVVLKPDRRLDSGADITSRMTIADIALEKRQAAADVARSLDVIPEHKYGASIFGFSTRGVNKRKIAEIENDPRVAYVEIDQLIQLDPIEMTPEEDEGSRNLRGRRLAPSPNRGKPGGGGGGGGAGSTPSGQTTPWGITRVNGGIPYTGSNVAWVIDSGIDLDHSDLNVDASRGYTAFTKGKDATVDDGDGHGTHVAGTIAAKDNSEGVIGVAAGATVIPVKVLNSRGSGSYSGVIGGVDHVAANGSNGDVANMSLGGPISQALDNAIITAAAATGVQFVLAAGNESGDANNSSPARTNGNNIYTISASDINDNFAWFSNYGNPPIDFCAPGVSIESTWKGGGYNTISGTSMAAPHAAGVLLLGNPGNGGNVNGDPDGEPDSIIAR